MTRESGPSFLFHFHPTDWAIAPPSRLLAEDVALSRGALPTTLFAPGLAWCLPGSKSWNTFCSWPLSDMGCRAYPSTGQPLLPESPSAFLFHSWVNHHRDYSTVVRNRDPGIWLPGPKLWFHHLNWWPWVCYLTSWCLSFLICKMEMIILTISWNC